MKTVLEKNKTNKFSNGCTTKLLEIRELVQPPKEQKRLVVAAG